MELALAASVRWLGAWPKGFALGSGRGHHATRFSPKLGLPALPPVALSRVSHFGHLCGCRGGERARVTGRTGWLTQLPPRPAVAVPSGLAAGLPLFACEV